MNHGASGPVLPRQRQREKEQQNRLETKSYPHRNRCTTLSLGGSDLDENGGLRLRENQQWKHYKCQRGIIHFKKKLRFTSPELKALWAEHVKTRASERPPLMIEVKRLDGFVDCLIWKKPNGREGTLHLVDEDARRVAHMTWREHNLSLESDSRREVDNEPARRKSRNTLTTVDQDQQIEAAERNRTVTAADEMAGESVPDAKNRTTLARERKWGAKQAQAAGVKAESIVVPEMMQPPKPHGGSIAQSYAERVRARRAAQNGGGSSAR